MEKKAVIEHEKMLRKARLTSHIEVLDELIHDDLIFLC